MAKERDFLFIPHEKKMGHDIAKIKDARAAAKIDRLNNKLDPEIKNNPSLRAKVAIEAIYVTIQNESLERIANRHRMSVSEVKAIRDTAYKYLTGESANFFRISGKHIKHFDNQSAMFRAAVEGYKSGNYKTIADRFKVNPSIIGDLAYKLELDITSFFKTQKIDE